MNTLTCKNYFQTVDIKLRISLSTSPSPMPLARGDYYHSFGGFPSRPFSIDFMHPWKYMVLLWVSSIVLFVDEMLLSHSLFHMFGSFCILFFSPTESLREFSKSVHRVLPFGHCWELMLTRGDKGHEGNPGEVMAATERHLTIASGWTFRLFLIVY